MTFVETFLEVHLEDSDACKEALVIEQLGCKVGMAPKRSILSCSFTQVLSLAEPSAELCLGMNHLPKCTLLLRSCFPLRQAEASQGGLQGSSWSGFAAVFFCCIPDAVSGGVLGRYEWVMYSVLGRRLGDLTGLVRLCFLL